MELLLLVKSLPSDLTSDTDAGSVLPPPSTGLHVLQVRRVHIKKKGGRASHVRGAAGVPRMHCRPCRNWTSNAQRGAQDKDGAAHAWRCRGRSRRQHCGDCGGGGSPSTSPSRYGARCVNATLQTRGWRRRKRQAAAIHKKRYDRWTNWDRCEEQETAGWRTITSPWKRWCRFSDACLDSKPVDVIEILSFRRFTKEPGRCDRTQFEEVCVGGCSLSRLWMLYLDRWCVRRP